MRWIWLVVLWACGDNVVPRIEPRTYEVGDVTYTQPGKFHDTLRDEDCEPQYWADGAKYCTPAYRDPVYTDSACTDALAPPTARYTPTYFTIAGLTSLRRLHPVSPSRRAPAQYWLRSRDTCDGPYPAPAGTQWGEIGDELDESAFVRMRLSPEGTGRLQTIAWHTSDGLYQPIGFHDRDLGVDCNVVGELGRDRDEIPCLPPAAAILYYANDTCTEPVADVADDEPVPLVELGCDMVASVGSELTTPVFALLGGTCTPAILPAGVRAFAIGAPVDVPVLSRVRQGSGRVQSITLVSGDVRVPDVFLHDTALGVDCEPGPSIDEPRCVPPYRDIDTYFRDGICSQPVPIAIENVGGCMAPVSYARGADGFHAIGGIETAPLYVPSTGDTCMQQTPDGEPHDVGPVLPVDTFVPAL